MTSGRTLPLAGLRIATIAVLLLAWELAGRGGLLFGNALPPVSDVARSLGQSAGSSVFWAAVLDTVLQWAGGLAGSVLLGIPLGLLIGYRSLTFRSTRTTIDFLRTIPPVMLLPLFVLVLGSGPRMVVLLAIYAAIWPVLVQTISGVRAVESLTMDTARVFHISATRRFHSILLPAVSPFVFSGLRVSAVIALFIAIVCELVAGSPGLGQLMTQAQLAGDSPGIYAYILATAVIGLLINAAVGLLERRALAWHESQHTEASR